MSYWMAVLSIGGLALLGLGLAAVLYLDGVVEAELRVTEDERRWTSVI